MFFNLGPEPRVKNKLLFLVTHSGYRVVGFATENVLISSYVCGMYACMLGVFTCVFLTVHSKLGSDWSFLVSPFLASCSAEDVRLQ